MALALILLTPGWHNNGNLVFPEVLESTTGQFCVSNRVLDVLVSQVQLDRSSIVSVIGQLVARTVSQHVGMYGHSQLGYLSGSGNDLPHR